MRLETALEAVAEYGDGDRLEGLKRHVDPTWIEEALAWSGVVTLRKRRLPAEQVLWLVIGMGLMRDSPIERVVDKLELALPDRRRTLIAKSAISQARQRTYSRSAPRSGLGEAQARTVGEDWRCTDSMELRCGSLILLRIGLHSAAIGTAPGGERADIRWCEPSR